jgi:hypothetical protein
VFEVWEGGGKGREKGVWLSRSDGVKSQLKWGNWKARGEGSVGN